MAAYGKAVAQGSALGGTAMANRSRQASGKAWLAPGLDRVDGSLSAEALIEPQGETSRGHGGAEWESE